MCKDIPMKKLTILFSLLLCSLVHLHAAPAADLVPITALPETWSTGSRPAAWVQDDLYIIECWATWCSPCIASIPHIQALHEKYDGKGVHIIGLNVEKDKTLAELDAFLKKRPTVPTYSIAIDTHGLASLLNVSGIPRAFILKAGKVLWTGHPNKLTPTVIDALKAGKPIPEEPQDAPTAKKPNAFAGMDRYETLADTAAQNGDWDAAIKAQRKAIHNHPLQKQLPTPYLPPVVAEVPAQPHRKTITPTTPTTTTGDSAPYAKLIGKPIAQSKDTFTIVSYWVKRHVHHYSLHNQEDIPSFAEAQMLKIPYFLHSVTQGVGYEEITLFGTVPFKVDIDYVQELDPTLFAHNTQNDAPFVAVLLDNTLVWQGALEALPTAIRTCTDPSKTTPIALKAQIEHDKTVAKAFLEKFKALKAAKGDKQYTIALNDLLAGGIPPRWQSFILPHYFSEVYGRKDAPAAAKLYRKLVDDLKDDTDALEILAKLPSAWTELRALTHVESSRLAERLGDAKTKLDPSVQVAWYIFAANAAKAAKDMDRCHDMVRKAIAASDAGVRWQAINHHKRALPSR